jgi:TolB-like protein
VIYQFSDYKLDTQILELSFQESILAVEPRVFSLLQVLIENREKVLNKDELIHLVWQGKPLSDSVVSSCIKSARKIIGDDGKSQNLIKTIHGRGFRFIGHIIELEQTTNTAIESLNTEHRPHQKEIDQAVVLDKKPSIIVLPFSNIQPSDDLPILPDGFVIDIILGLSRLRWLKVISRASSFQFDHNTQNNSIVSQTGAKYCLSGAIERVNKQLILTIELSNIQSNNVIWIERFDGPLADIHQLRSDIVNKAVATLEVQISTNEALTAQLTAPENLDAWAAYHLAMSHLYRFTQADNAKATSLFEQAIKLEPQFARAHAGLSCCMYQHVFNHYPGQDLTHAAVQTRKHAERAIELDPLDAFCNFAMGRCYWLNATPEDSLPWLERSLSVNPNFAQAYYAHGLASLMSNRPIDAKQDAAIAIELSPLDPFLYGFYGVRAYSFLAAGDYQNAKKWANHAARQPGALFMMDLMACVANALAGDDQEAKQWAQRAGKRRPDLTSDYFFRALPFNSSPLRTKIAGALNLYGF